MLATADSLVDLSIFDVSHAEEAEPLEELSFPLVNLNIDLKKWAETDEEGEARDSVFMDSAPKVVQPNHMVAMRLVLPK